MRLLLALCVVLGAGCATGAGASFGPTVTRPSGMSALVPTRADTLAAIKLVDKRLTAVGLPAVAGKLHVTWLMTYVFDIDDSGSEMLGVTEGLSSALSGRAPFMCRVTVATQLQTRPSGTSLAHEMLHCSMGSSPEFEYDGDGAHRRPEWSAWLTKTEQALAAAGL